MKNIFFYIVILTLIFSCSMSDEIENLDNGYLFISESKFSQSIQKVNGDTIIPCTVLEYDYNKDFIVASQIDNENCIDELKKQDVKFWIIDCNTNKVYKNLNFTQYLKTKHELNISKKLKLTMEK